MAGMVFLLVFNVFCIIFWVFLSRGKGFLNLLCNLEILIVSNWLLKGCNVLSREEGVSGRNISLFLVGLYLKVLGIVFCVNLLMIINEVLFSVV